MSDKNIKRVVDLNTLIHTPARLAILMFLMPRGCATFPEIIEALELTSGNLSSHSKKLASADLLEIEKTFVGDKPTTIIYITQQGRSAILQYAEILKSALDELA